MWKEKSNISHLTTKAPKVRNLVKDRAYAFTMDLFLIGIINKAIMFTYVNFVKTFFHQLPIGIRSNLANQMNQVSFINFLVVFSGYFLLSYYLSEGKTPGKIIFHLKVQSPHSHDGHLSLRSSMLRTLGYFVTIPSAFTLLLIPFFRKDRKGIPDWISNSFVMGTEEEKYIESLEDIGSTKVTPLFPEDPVSKQFSSPAGEKKKAS